MPVEFKALDYPISIAEMQGFSRDANRLLSDEARESLIYFVALNPSAGDLIPGTGGLRKLRWGRDGKGKRGGVRVIYYFRDLNMPLYMIAIYGKGEKSNLTAAERRDMRRLVDELVHEYRQRAQRVARGKMKPA